MIKRCLAYAPELPCVWSYFGYLSNVAASLRTQILVVNQPLGTVGSMLDNETELLVFCASFDELFLEEQWKSEVVKLDIVCD